MWESQAEVCLGIIGRTISCKRYSWWSVITTTNRSSWLQPCSRIQLALIRLCASTRWLFCQCGGAPCSGSQEMCFCCNGWSSNVTHRKIGGISVENELERLWKDKILRNLHNNALVDEPVSKSVLCHCNGAGAHPAFIQASEVKKYENAMTLVAMAITGEQWGQCCSGR